MKRITVDDVRAAYEKTGLVPMRHIWLSDNCACALSACMLANGVNRKEIERADDNFDCETLAAERLKLEQVYADYFISGFDGVRNTCAVTEEELQGHQDGLACAAAIFDEVQS